MSILRRDSEGCHGLRDRYSTVSGLTAHNGPTVAGAPYLRNARVAVHHPVSRPALERRERGGSSAHNSHKTAWPNPTRRRGRIPQDGVAEESVGAQPMHERRIEATHSGECRIGNAAARGPVDRALLSTSLEASLVVRRRLPESSALARRENRRRRARTASRGFGRGRLQQPGPNFPRRPRQPFPCPRPQ